MLKFFNDYEKVNKPEPAPQESQGAAVAQESSSINLKPETVPAMTVDDVKSYFDAMKESLISEIKEQMLSYQTKSDANINTNSNGGEGDASNTDL